ncbi:MAG: hypothetical protein QOJ64_2448 [Acidobacteriota bacterium]|jgi:hypothetical protein|nr:hypothetical protein [Acidobacteriota bacterium]
MNINPQQESSAPSQLMSDNGSSSVSTDPSALINLTEARKILGVSPNKMSKLVTDGTLHYEVDPLDQRVKLVPRADVEKLKQHSRKS